MEGHIQKGLLENIDLHQLQGEIAKLSPGVLRGIEGGALHFITIPRTYDQEYIDHSLLNPEYIATHLQNGVLVDLLQNQTNTFLPHIQNHSIMNRQFLSDADLIAHLPIQANEETSISDSDQKVAQAFLQYVHKNGTISSHISTNEAQVIVSNKINQSQPPPLIKIPKTQILNDNQNPAILAQPMNILKMEMDLETKNEEFFDESDSDNESLILSPATLPKQILPHKKRISTKLKTTQQIATNDLDRELDSFDVDVTNTTRTLTNFYKCELCGLKSENQLVFFTHLKQHYEPSDTNDIKTEYKSNKLNSINEINLTTQLNCQTDINNQTEALDENNSKVSDENEFSDTEDMLEGIRGVVDKVQESVDEDLNIEAANVKNWDIQHLNENIVYNESAVMNNTTTLEQSENDLILYYSQDRNCVVNENNTPINTNILRQQLLKFPLDKYIEPEDLDRADEAIIGKMTLKDIELEFTEEITEVSDNEGKTKRKKKVKSYKCNRCNKVCNSKNALHYHFLSHTGERPHQCEVCGKSFFAGSALKVHKRLHSGDKPYNCNFCSRAFRQWGDLKYHITSLHTDEKNHQCEFCGKDFSRRYSLVIHRRIHTGERNYKCEYCDKTFRASSYLQDHRRIHTGEKPHVCSICAKKFRVRGDLNRHLKIHMRSKAIKMKQKVSDNVENSGSGDIKQHESLDKLKFENDLGNEFLQQTDEKFTTQSIQRNCKKKLKEKLKRKDDELLFVSNLTDVNGTLQAKILNGKDNESDAVIINHIPSLANTSDSLSKSLPEALHQNWPIDMDDGRFSSERVDDDDDVQSNGHTTAATILTATHEVRNGDGQQQQQFVVWPIEMPFMS